MWKRNSLRNFLSSFIVFTRLTSKKTLSKFDLSMKMKNFNDQKRYDEALKLFVENPSAVTDLSLNQALKACSKQRNVKTGKLIHQQLSSSSIENPFIQCSLMNFYMECYDPVSAENIFNQTKTKTSSMFATMMKGFVKNNLPGKTIELFLRMTIKPTDIVLIALFNACARLANVDALQIGRKAFLQAETKYFNNDFFLHSAMDMFIKCDDIENAEKIFEKKKILNLIDYSAMMKGFNQSGNPLKTWSLFKQMEVKSIKADHVIFILVINACSKIGIASICRLIEDRIPTSFLNIRQIENSLIDMWGKSGLVDEARRVFDKIDQPDTVTYNSMINSFGINGMGLDAVDLFRRMPNHLMDEFTYLVVLNACSHSGLINEARSIFDQIQIKTTKIYTVMVDCLSRLFLFDEAQQVIDQFEKSNSPDVVMYMTVLSGARNQQNTSLAEELFKKIEKKFPKDRHMTSALVLLANTYSATDNFQRSSNVRQKISETMQKKQVGISWTEVNGEIFTFRAQDQSNPRAKEIYAELDRIRSELIQHGHQFDSNWITRSVENDDTVESVLCGHSEKIALAFNLIQRPIPSPIQITKNLRICGDCHRATKLIARIRQLEIIMRDKNRLHHFRSNGQCSCQDHF